MRTAHQQHHHLLGRQRARPDRRAERTIQRRQRELALCVRTAHRQHHHLLGRQRVRPDRRAGRTIQRHQRGRGSIPADCAPTGTITCWGYNAHGQTDAPSRQFNAVSADGLHTCGLRTNGTITCWGRQRPRPDRRAGRTIQRRQRRRDPYLRTAHRRHHHLLGAPADGKPTTRRRSRLDSPPRECTERGRPAK